MYTGRVLCEQPSKNDHWACLNGQNADVFTGGTKWLLYETVACDQADGNALSGEETQIHERKGLPSRGLLACHSLPSVVLITKVFFTEFQIYRVIPMPNK